MTQKQCFIICALLFILVGCGAPVASQPNATKLTSSLILSDDLVYESTENNIIIDYPADWLISGDDMIFIQPSEDDFPKIRSSSAPPFMLYTMGPYADRFSDRWHIPRSATEIARKTAQNATDASELLEPIEPVDINGHDGAVFLIERGEQHQYVVILRITEQVAVGLGALGPSDRSDEMKDVLNAIALNIQPLTED